MAHSRETARRICAGIVKWMTEHGGISPSEWLVSHEDFEALEKELAEEPKTLVLMGIPVREK